MAEIETMEDLLAGSDVYTDERHEADRREIAAAFASFGLPWEAAVEKIQKHEYQHDGGDFDELAERYIEWACWERMRV